MHSECAALSRIKHLVSICAFEKGKRRDTDTHLNVSKCNVD